MTKTISINASTFILHPSAAVFWKEESIVLISDVHLGKISHFRKHGVAVPENSVSKNFEELTNVLEFFKPKKLIFLGDLFHSKKNNEWSLFEHWIKSVSTEIILIEGNHDIISKHHYDDINIKVIPELIINDFLLTHHPEEREGLFNFCGHIHPAIRLYGTGRQFLKLPCFFQKQNQMILPAFGEFTGTYFLVPDQNDCVYAIANNEVILVC